MALKIELNGKAIKAEGETTPLEVAEQNKLNVQELIAVRFNGEMIDWKKKLEEDGKIEFLGWEEDEAKKVFWHSTAHVMAQAVLELFPETKLTIGPPIENGFYYDFYMGKRSLSSEDLKEIEKKMKEHISNKEEFIRSEKTKDEALKLYKDNKFKKEIITELPAGKPSFYTNEKFTDLCRGPHLQHTKKIQGFKLTKVSSAYWRADEKKESLQRVYGISFPKKELLNEFIKMHEEAEKRNHIKLGHELDIFSISSLGPGFPFLNHNGNVIWDGLITFIKEELFKREYKIIQTPIMLSKELWVKSGHYEHYKEHMYFTSMDNFDYAMKPMNCPGSTIVFGQTRRSYKELPLKLAEFGLVHRHERSGVLNGLMRVRKFVQDDAHIYCTSEQIKEQVIELFDLIDVVYKTLGFEYDAVLSTRPEKFIGETKTWDIAENALKESMKVKGLPVKINEADGAFYGPKIDFNIRDALGRHWQLATIQLDFQMPERFDLSYIGKDDNKHRPVMIHRVIYGSMERLLGILIEHFAGAFPSWLSPVQVQVIPVNETVNDYAKEINKELRNIFIRSEVELENDSVGKKVYGAVKKKIPYIVVVGEDEKKQKKIMVRNRNVKDQKLMDLKDFKEKLLKEINERKIDLKVV